MKTILLVSGVIVALCFVALGEMLIDAWREMDSLRKKIERLKTNKKNGDNNNTDNELE
jgi:uncharacterized membrane protein (DUF106 family)